MARSRANLAGGTKKVGAGFRLLVDCLTIQLRCVSKGFESKCFTCQER